MEKETLDFGVLFTLLAEFEQKVVDEIGKQVEMVSKRELYFDPDDYSNTHLMETTTTGRVIPRRIDISRLERYINKLKNDSGGDEKLKETVKKQGLRIQELTQQLKEKP